MYSDDFAEQQQFAILEGSGSEGDDDDGDPSPAPQQARVLAQPELLKRETIVAMDLETLQRSFKALGKLAPRNDPLAEVMQMAGRNPHTRASLRANAAAAATPTGPPSGERSSTGRRPTRGGPAGRRAQQKRATLAASMTRTKHSQEGQNGLDLAQQRRKRGSRIFDLGHFRLNRFYGCLCKLESPTLRAFNKWKAVAAYELEHDLQARARKILLARPDPAADAAAHGHGHGHGGGGGGARSGARSDDEVSTLTEWARQTAPKLFTTFDNDRLRDVMAHVSFRAAAAGEPLFMQGDPGEHFMIVFDGCIQIFDTAPAQHAALLRRPSSFTVAELAKLSKREAAKVRSGEALVDRERALREQDLLGGFLGKPVADFRRGQAFGEMAMSDARILAFDDNLQDEQRAAQEAEAQEQERQRQNAAAAKAGGRRLTQRAMMEKKAQLSKAARRNASAVAARHSEILFISREVYARTFATGCNAEIISRNAIMKHLRTVWMLSDWGRSRLQALANNLVLRTYRRGDVVMREGEAPAGIFFVMGGQLSVACDPRQRRTRNQAERQRQRAAKDARRVQRADAAERAAAKALEEGGGGGGGGNSMGAGGLSISSSAARLQQAEGGGGDPPSLQRRGLLRPRPGAHARQDDQNLKIAAKLAAPTLAAPGLAAAVGEIEISLMQAGEVLGEETALLGAGLAAAEAESLKAGGGGTASAAQVAALAASVGMSVGAAGEPVRESTVVASSRSVALLLLPMKNMKGFLSAAKFSQKTMPAMRELLQQRREQQQRRLKGARSTRKTVRKHLRQGQAVATTGQVPAAIDREATTAAAAAAVGPPPLSGKPPLSPDKRQRKQQRVGATVLPEGLMDPGANVKPLPRKWKAQLPANPRSRAAAGPGLGSNGVGHGMLGSNAIPRLPPAKNMSVSLPTLAAAKPLPGPRPPHHIGNVEKRALASSMPPIRFNVSRGESSVTSVQLSGFTPMPVTMLGLGGASLAPGHVRAPSPATAALTISAATQHHRSPSPSKLM